MRKEEDDAILTDAMQIRSRTVLKIGRVTLVGNKMLVDFDKKILHLLLILT
jgi:hypothetical protein